MSNSHLFMNAAFPRVPLKNGLGRYMCQLQRITLKFCKNHGSSRGVRDFIENHLLDFAREHPSVVVYVKPRRHKAPHVKAEYLNGQVHTLMCRDLSGMELTQYLKIHVSQSGYQEQRLIKMWHTETPSIQGVWTPFTHREPAWNSDKVFDPQYRQQANLPPTATEQLIEIFKQQQLEEKQAQ